MVKAVLLDFDGTLVNRDILDVVCGVVGKEAESERINAEFHASGKSGLEPLIARINFLKGVSQTDVEAKLAESAYLMPGAKELLSFLNARGIISILASGNIKPVLVAYQKMLGITYVVGSEPIMVGDVIQGITEAQFSSRSFKLDGIKKILSERHISDDETVAIGDSPADRQLFDFSRVSIAINPKGDIAEYADLVIHDDLTPAIQFIEKLLEP